jgi:hypothetical protein
MEEVTRLLRRLDIEELLNRGHIGPIRKENEINSTTFFH